MNPYEALANAIIIQAAKDYREGGRYVQRELRKFFRSSYFGILTTLDPEYLIQRLEERI